MTPGDLSFGLTAGGRAVSPHVSGVRTAEPPAEDGHNVEFNRSDDLPAFLQDLQKQCVSSSSAFASKPFGDAAKRRGRRRCGAGAEEQPTSSGSAQVPLGTLSAAAAALSRDIERRQKRAERRQGEKESPVPDAPGGDASSEEEDEIGSRASFVRAALTQRRVKREETREDARAASAQERPARKRNAEAAGAEEENSRQKRRKKKKKQTLGEHRESTEVVADNRAIEDESEKRAKGKTLGSTVDTEADEPTRTEGKKAASSGKKEKKRSATDARLNVQLQATGTGKNTDEPQNQKQRKRKERREAATDSIKIMNPTGHGQAKKGGGEEEGGEEGSSLAAASRAKGQHASVFREKSGQKKDAKRGVQGWATAPRNREGKGDTTSQILSWERSTGKTLQGRLIKFRRVVGEGEDGPGRRRSKTRSRQKNIRKDNRPDHLKPPHLQLGSKVPVYNLGSTS
ncbi:conserved hypothetical protein [Neospora caninum Liverpool]|uniref:Uncharacterized protein n=1 Tax=Neospora caninum (strain Liverpool) TaxID=572307 RepID=F0VJ61_NEOCL|nr:conserved hypothetical protein [Neospora caninum Liverpool]CBZ53772.1 conserved hypothetical protein [Neospora caninum Liverpool]CEL67764.1 TPA: hypothetical protein BN1204_035530 [Neospora caninum Liverpool]|eukprot:XP_003883804.1 conserved hypothetical protein [Neospora caninum Liverpool]